MMGLDELKQKIAIVLALKQSRAAVDQMIYRHSFRNKDSPLFDIFSFASCGGGASYGVSGDSGAEAGSAATSSTEWRVNPRTLLILYSVEGLLDDATGDSILFVLDRTTRADFQAHVALERPMTLVVLTASISASAEALSQRRGGVEDQLDMVRIDVVPGSAALGSFKAGMALLTRPTEALTRAEGTLTALEHGSARADAESALTDCCVWLLDSLQLIDEQFHNLVSNSETALQVLEAFMKRYSVVRQLHGMVMNPSGVFARLERFASQCGEAALRYRQRVTQLLLLLSELRTDAMWCSLLTNYALRLKLANPQQTQSLDNLTEIIPSLLKVLAVVFAAAGSCSSSGGIDATNISGSGASRNHPLLLTLKQKFLPLVSKNALQKCADLLSLNTIFNVASVPDAQEQQGYIMPLCTRPAVAAKLDHVSSFAMQFAALLHRYGRALEKHFPTPTYPSFRSMSGTDLAAESDDDNSPEDIVASTLHYAAARCTDLQRMIRQVDEVGCGMMTLEVRCLFDTIHLAASAFPMLDGTQFKNWHLFASVFDKTRTIKYTTVEPVVYQPYDVLENVAPRIVASTTASSSVPSNDVDEEKRILRSRVSMLSAELTEARELLATSSERLQQTQRGLEQAQELNMVLMQELRRAMSQQAKDGLAQATGGNTRLNYYQTLIASLAEEEEITLTADN